MFDCWSSLISWRNETLAGMSPSLSFGGKRGCTFGLFVSRSGQGSRQRRDGLSNNPRMIRSFSASRCLAFDTDCFSSFII